MACGFFWRRHRALQNPKRPDFAQLRSGSRRETEKKEESEKKYQYPETEKR